MITGDHKAIAAETCCVLGMGTNVLGTDSSDAGTGPREVHHARQGLRRALPRRRRLCAGLPEHKHHYRALRQQGFLVGMTGDGVNDALALKRADVGIAVQGATNAAQAVADIVLTEPGLSTIVTAIVTSRKIFQRMKNFVISNRVPERSCSSSGHLLPPERVQRGWLIFTSPSLCRHHHHPQRRHHQLLRQRACRSCRWDLNIPARPRRLA